jgi:hypothetical protein
MNDTRTERTKPEPKDKMRDREIRPATKRTISDRKGKIQKTQDGKRNTPEVGAEACRNSGALVRLEFRSV